MYEQWGSRFNFLPERLLAVALILGAMIWLVPSCLVRYGASFIFLWLLPGLAWVSLIPCDALDRAERMAVGLGLSFVVTPVITLLASYLPGPLSRTTLLAVVLGGTCLPVIFSVLVRLGQRRNMPKGLKPDRHPKRGMEKAGQHPFWQKDWVWLCVAVLIGVSVRVVNLSYSEFQGDEAVVMVGAASALEGDEAIIFQHKKAPAELLVAMAGWRLTGVTDEGMARLPFAWASTLGLTAVFLCGRRLGYSGAGGIAALLLAIEGFLVGFGRIVQYQSLVFALSALGLLCLLAYYERGHSSLVIVAAVLFAGGALAHYDALLALPAGVILAIARLWRDRRRIGQTIIAVTIAMLIGGLLLALFYFPLLRSPYIGGTLYYLSGRIGGQVYNHLRSTFELSAVYDTVYFLAAVLLALAGQTLATWARWGRVGLAVACVSIVAAATGLVRPELWLWSNSTLAWLPFVILLAGAVLVPRQPASVRAMWLWMGLPALFYLFFVAVPLTHIYTALPALALLASIGLTNLWRWLAGKSRIALYAASMGGVAVYALCGFYTIMVFVDHTPEYRRTFPQSSNPLYWTPYKRMPQAGWFGFPYRAGWKVVGQLMDEKRLAGTYDSNEEQDITDYYTRHAVRLSCATPDFYIVALNVQDEVNIRWDQIEREYSPIIVVTVGGQPKLTVYRRGVITTSPEIYRSEDYDSLFDRGSTPERVAIPRLQEMGEVNWSEYVPLDVTIGGFARLTGYKVDDEYATPGGYVELTLLWQALQPTPVDYHVFTHLHDGKTMRGQLDGQPGCGNIPTSHWRPGEFIIDPYRIPINDDASPGPVPLTVGMYDFSTMQRLPVYTADGSLSGDNVYLADVMIKAR